MRYWLALGIAILLLFFSRFFDIRTLSLLSPIIFLLRTYAPTCGYYDITAFLSLRTRWTTSGRRVDDETKDRERSEKREITKEWDRGMER